jgi:hypothetical protein
MSPSTTAASRVSPRGSARFTGELLNAAESSGRVMLNTSRAS